MNKMNKDLDPTIPVNLAPVSNTGSCPMFFTSMKWFLNSWPVTFFGA
jgi:hypothetical protein